MKKVLFSLAAVAALSFVASTASAQCSFNEPGKAKGIKTDMVRSYSACPGVTMAAPNTVTMAGVPGCIAPVSGTPVTRSAFQFSSKGKCSLKTSAKLESPCSTGTGIDCSNLTLKAKCGGITEPDGVTPISSGAWSLNTVARTTFNDQTGGDMTIIDFPAQFSFGTPKKGKMKMQQDTNALLNFLFGPGSELPGCTAIEIVSVSIADPVGDVFAVMGSSTR